MFSGYGIKLISDPLLCVRQHVRRTFHRTKRIAKKWRKDPRNYDIVPDSNFYQIDRFTFIAHPDTLKRFGEHIGAK